jgi:hypothetical protein
MSNEQISSKEKLSLFISSISEFQGEFENLGRYIFSHQLLKAILEKHNLVYSHAAAERALFFEKLTEAQAE